MSSGSLLKIRVAESELGVCRSRADDHGTHGGGVGYRDGDGSLDLFGHGIVFARYELTPLLETTAAQFASIALLQAANPSSRVAVLRFLQLRLLEVREMRAARGVGAGRVRATGEAGVWRGSGQGHGCGHGE